MTQSGHQHERVRAGAKPKKMKQYKQTRRSRPVGKELEQFKQARRKLLAQAARLRALLRAINERLEGRDGL